MKAIPASGPPIDPTRSRIMRAVRGKDTWPELTIRRLADEMGLRYELHPADLPGRPDMVFRETGRAVFVHGCFWHRHEGCRRATTPRTRRAWWEAKLAGNVDRDIRTAERLAAMGWRSLTIWECELSEEGSVASALDAFARGAPAADSPKSIFSVDSKKPLVGFDAPPGDKARDQRSAPTEEKSMPRKSTKSGPTGKTRVAKAAPAAPKRSAVTSAPTKSKKQSSSKAAEQKVASLRSSAKPTVAKPTASAASKPNESRPAANERPLPGRYSAATDTDAGTVTIRKGPASVTVRMQSYASVANALAMLEPSGGVLEPAATLELTEPFTGSSTSISADSLDDVFSALAALALSASPGVAAGTAPAKSASAKPGPKSPETGGKKPTAKAPARPVAASKPPEPKAEAKPKIATPIEADGSVKGKPPAKPPAKAVASSTSWLDRDFQREYVGENFRLVRTELAIDPKDRRAVLGPWKEGDGVRGSGYEIVSGKRHIGWVIAEEPKSFILTGAFDLRWSQHRAISGLLARIQVVVMPLAKVG